MESTSLPHSKPKFKRHDTRILKIHSQAPICFGGMENPVFGFLQVHELKFIQKTYPKICNIAGGRMAGWGWQVNPVPGAARVNVDNGEGLPAAAASGSRRSEPAPRCTAGPPSPASPPSGSGAPPWEGKASERWGGGCFPKHADKKAGC